jgi:hypothetical protein
MPGVRTRPDRADRPVRPAGPRSSPRGPRRPRLGVAVAAAGIAALAAWLRLADLGRLSFWSDEYPHVFAGRSLIAEGRPLLPSGREYRRALLQTAAVGASMRLLGEGEAAARLPSALAGAATVPLLWLAARRRFGDAAALGAAAVLAIMPAHVAHARSARFYAAFALAYAATALFASRWLRRRRAADGAAAAASFAVAFHLQPLAVLVVVPLAVDATIGWRRAAGSLRARGGAGLALLAGVAATLLALAPGTAEGLGHAVRRPVPGVELDPGLRLATLGRLFAFVQPAWAWALLGPAAVVGLRRAGRDGIALACHAVLPALLLAVGYRTATPGDALNARYLLHLAPALALLAGVGVGALLGWARVAVREGPRGPGRSRIAPALAVAGLATAAAVGLRAALPMPGAPHPGPVIPRPDWRLAAAVVGPRLAPGDALVSTHPLAVAWYLGRCPLWLRAPALAAPYMEGERDVYCGTTLLPDAEAVNRLLAERPAGWVIADASWDRWVDPAARALVETRLERVPLEDPTLLVFRWSRPR